MEKCLFCEIVNENVPADKVYENEYVCAFLDINPVNKGHVLLVPKEHYRNLHELPDSLVEKLAVKTKALASAIRQTVSADGINIGMNNGEAAGQVIFHAHIHIMPRFENDGHEHWSSNYTYQEGEAKETAQELSKELSQIEE